MHLVVVLSLDADGSERLPFIMGRPDLKKESPNANISINTVMMLLTRDSMLVMNA